MEVEDSSSSNLINVHDFISSLSLLQNQRLHMRSVATIDYYDRIMKVI